MKKTKLLTLTALTLIGLLGLSSCGKGEKGDTGDTGPAGETGPKGDKGDPGENGEDGKDGATWLTGTSKPADSLGNLGDMYLNTTNGDVYQKEESGWTLKMNIKGEDGENGKDGANGSNGSTGPKGETAWSNTILPSENGYVIPSVGSGVSGTKFTIKAYPDTTYYLKSLELVDKSGKVTTPSYSLDETTNVVVSEEVSMVEGGYVISATFESTSSLGTTGYVDGKKYNGTYDAAGNFIPTTEVTDAPIFAGGNGKSEETALEVESVEQLNDINEVEETYFKLNSDIETTSLTLSGSGIEGETKEKVIDLNENTMNFTTTSSSFVVNKGLDLTLKNGTIDSNEENGIASIGLGDRTNKDVSGGTLNLEGMTLNNLNNGIVIESKGSELNIKDTTINSALMPLSTNASLGKDVTDVSITVDNSKLISKGNEANRDGVGLLINTNVDVNIVNNSYIEGPRQALIVRGGNVNIEDSTICFSNTYKGGDTEFDNVWEDGNEVAYSGIVVGDTSTNAYDYPASLTLSNVTYSRSNPVSNEVTTLSEESETRSEPYDIYMYGESETNTATLNIDASTYAQFDSSNIYKNEHSFIDVTGLEATSTNSFVDGQLYSELYLKDDGSVDEVLSTKVDGVKFASGTGTEEDPLVAETVEQLKSISNINLDTDLYVKLVNGTRYEIDNKIVINENANLNLDLNGATITPIESMKNSQNVDIEGGALKFLIDIYGFLTIDDSTKTEENPAGNGYLLGGRGVIQCLANSSLTVNSGTLTDISRSSGSAIYCDPTATLVINYVEIYCSNFAVGAETSKVTINGGKFVSVSNNTIKSETGAITYTYCVTVGDGSHLVKGEVIGIQGGTSCTNGSATIESGWNSKTSAEEAKKLYQEVLEKTNQAHPYTEEELTKIEEDKCFYGLYIAGETTSGPSVIVKGGNYYSSYRSAVQIGNSNDGGAGTLANCRIEAGTFISGNEKSTSISVDDGKEENNYGKGSAEIVGGYFLKNDETKKWLEANISEGYELKETTLDDGTAVYEVVLSE